jgi:hypothetical protein
MKIVVPRSFTQKKMTEKLKTYLLASHPIPISAANSHYEKKFYLKCYKGQRQKAKQIFLSKRLKLINVGRDHPRLVVLLDDPHASVFGC